MSDSQTTSYDAETAAAVRAADREVCEWESLLLDRRLRLATSRVELNAHAAIRDELLSKYNSEKQRRDLLSKAINRRIFACKIRNWIDGTVTKVGGLLISAAGGAAICFILAYRSESAAAAASVGLIVGAIAWWPILHLPSVAELQSDISALLNQREVDAGSQVAEVGQLKQSESLLRESEGTVDHDLRLVKAAEAGLSDAVALS